MIVCPKCSNRISDRGASCPYCKDQSIYYVNAEHIAHKGQNVAIDPQHILPNAERFYSGLRDLLKEDSFITSKTRAKFIAEHCETYDQAMTVLRGAKRQPLFGK